MCFGMAPLKIVPCLIQSRDLFSPSPPLPSLPSLHHIFPFLLLSHRESYVNSRNTDFNSINASFIFFSVLLNVKKFSQQVEKKIKINYNERCR